MNTYENYQAEVMADSIVQFNQDSLYHQHRLTSIRVVFPRIVLSELNTHRLFSRNSASSRAIPVKKMIESVMTNPFIPNRFPRTHKGMQAPDDAWVTKDSDEYPLWKNKWLEARDKAVAIVSDMNDTGISKQLANRILEPFLMHQVIISSTEWENFLGLRAHGDAQNEMQILATLILDALNDSEPTLLRAGEWHTPFGDCLDLNRLNDVRRTLEKSVNPVFFSVEELSRMVSVARCARISYDNMNGTDDYEKDIKLFLQLKDSGHFSPFEHVARAMSHDEYFKYAQVTPSYIEYGWCANFRGFIQLRRTFVRKVENRQEPRLNKWNS